MFAKCAGMSIKQTANANAAAVKMDTLIFVYNVDSGFFNTLKDTAHKTVSPATYACKLCQLSFGAVSMKRPWREYLQQLPFKKKFLHRNEFRQQYPDCRDVPLPAIFIQTAGACALIVSAEEINRQKTLTNLIAVLDAKLKAI